MTFPYLDQGYMTDSSILFPSNRTSTSSLTTDWTTDCGVSRSLEAIITDLMQRIESFGFDSFIYQGAPVRMRQDLKKPARHRLMVMKHVEECSTVICSHPHLLLMIRYYYQAFAQEDINFERSTRLSSPFIHHHSWEPVTRCNKTGGFFRSAGIHSILNWPVNVMTGQHWSGLYRLHSFLSEHELQQNLCKVQPELSHVLLLFHLELIGSYRDSFNPYKNMSLFHDNALKVVAGLARGLGRKALAAKLGITERGVDYHTEHLCQKLDASNKMDLIRICHELELI